MAPADCSAFWPLNPVQGDYVYEVIGLWPVSGQPRTYQIQYRDTAGVADRVGYVSQWWTATKRDSASLMHFDERACVVLVDVPQSKSGHRPYYVAAEASEQAARESAQALETAVLWPLCALLVLLLVPSWFGTERVERCIAAASAGGILITSLIIGHCCIELPWQEFERARAYWEWFDALPKAGGFLLPIAADDLVHLLRGPPNYTDIHAGAWATSTLLLAAVWIGAVAPAAVEGCYWLVTPHPLEQLHRRTLAEGRAPTVAELDAALHRAVAGKKAWQIEIMRRKAEAFMRRFADAGMQ